MLHLMLHNYKLNPTPDQNLYQALYIHTLYTHTHHLVRAHLMHLRIQGSITHVSCAMSQDLIKGKDICKGIKKYESRELTLTIMR